MIATYGKTYATLYRGSMVGAGAVVFAVMGYVIANGVPRSRDPESDVVVELNARLLAMVLGESEEEVEAAIKFLGEPDPNSRSKADGGRRLVAEGQYLYRVVNGRHYRDLADAEKRAEQLRRASARYRAKKAAAGLGIPLAGEGEWVEACLKGASDAELDAIAERWAPKRGKKK